MTRDDFELWLFQMDDELEAFVARFSAEQQRRLDYTPDSLAVLERWLLERYAGTEQIMAVENKTTLDGAVRYIGETFRKNLGGKWDVNLTDPKDAFYKLPVITGFPGMKVAVSPYSLAGACVDRRTGAFLQTILANNTAYQS